MRLGNCFYKMMKRIFLIRPYFQVMRYRLHIDNDDNADDEAKPCDHPKGCMPPKMISQYETDGKAKHLAGRKRHLHEAHNPSSHFHFKKIADDSKTHRPDHSPKQAGNDSCYQ